MFFLLVIFFCLLDEFQFSTCLCLQVWVTTSNKIYSTVRRGGPHSRLRVAMVPMATPILLDTQGECRVMVLNHPLEGGHRPPGVFIHTADRQTRVVDI